VEFDFTGTIADSGEVFDTTDEKTAKEHGIWDEDQKFAPRIICLGESQILPGLDSNMTGKEPGKEYEFTLQPEEAFGKKDAKLIQLIPTAKFRKEDIEPEVGMQVTVDDDLGTVKAVTGGRTMVDFNHPLSGKDLSYKVKITRILTEPDEKIRSVIANEIRQEAEVKVVEKAAIVKLKEKLPEDIAKVLENRIKGLVDISGVKFQ